MRGLVENGLIEDEVAERYRMTTREVKQQLDAIEFMEREYFPITTDPTDPEHRTKFSYFLDFRRMVASKSTAGAGHNWRSGSRNGSEMVDSTQVCAFAGFRGSWTRPKPPVSWM